MSRSKYWLFTLFGDMPDNATPLVLPEGAGYLVYQRETAPETGRLHYQCYVEFTKVKRLTALKKIYPTAHWDNRKGTKEEAIHYVTKPHDDCVCPHCDSARAGPDAPVGRSLPPVHLGEPSDEATGPKKLSIDDLFKMMEAGHPRDQIIRRMPSVWQRYRNTISDWDAYKGEPAQKPRKVILCYGNPRLGKSHWATHELGPYYKVPPPKQGSIWFNGYDGQPMVLFDEYSGALALDEWKMYTDVYPLRVPTKGGFTWYNPDAVVITTNEPISEWYARKTKRGDDSTRDRVVSLGAIEDRVHEWHYWALYREPQPPLPAYRTMPFPGWIYHASTNPLLQPVEVVPRSASPDMTNDPYPFPPRPLLDQCGDNPNGPLLHRQYSFAEYIEWEKRRVQAIESEGEQKRKRCEAEEEEQPDPEWVKRGRVNKDI